MKAVVMAGGEGTRLRPMTVGMPKPLLPVLNRPIMEHVLRLLKRHGFDETVVTVQFLASHVRNYFGDGDDLGMHLQYATEEAPLGTAGSVKNAETALKGDTFLVISGDALTDFDLTDLIDFHRKRSSLVTICLTRVPNPLEFGITIVDDEGKVQRFLEKPTWGQVFSDTVNTGIYVMEPEVFQHVATGESVDWSGDVFPALLKAGAPIHGYVAEGYWEDVGTQESYMKAHVDALDRKVAVDIDGFEIAPGIWVAEGAEVDPDAKLLGPLYVGDYSKVDGGTELRDYTVLGSNVVVRHGAFLHRAVVHDNAFIGPGTNLRGCVIGKNTDIMRGARVEDGAVIGDECIVEDEAIVQSEVKVYPFKTIEAGAVVNTSVIWESRGQRNLFGPRGVSGIVNVEITPELVVRLCAAFASTVPKGATVTVSRDVSRAARALKRAAVAALNTSACNVRDLEVAPPPITRLETARGSAGGIMITTTPGHPESVDIRFLDERGADLSASAQRKLERVLQRQEFRRAFPGEIGALTFPPRAVETYVDELIRTLDVGSMHDSGLKVVVDTAGGTASEVMPTLLGRVELDALIVNGRLDERYPTELPHTRDQALQRMGGLVSSASADFGIRFDPVGERIAIVDERGRALDDGRALLLMVDLVAAERKTGRVAVPVTTTRVVEQVARYHGVSVQWTTTSPDDLTVAAGAPDVLLVGDGRGGFVVPTVGRTIDGYAAFVMLLGMVARTRMSLSAIDERIPEAFVRRQEVPTPWAVKGQVMRSLLEAAGDREVDTTDGVRVIQPDGRWALVLPDPSEAVTHVWVEGYDEPSSNELLAHWVDVVEQAGR
jgi:mannose-1-phosphate guanylyltransferase/phosphomannomutase